MKIRKILIIGMITLLGTGVGGCSIKENTSTEQAKETEEKQTIKNLVLTERQKKILQEEGLSTNVEELTYSQKSSIIAIEEMLVAVEEKYDRSFSYTGYIAPGIMEEEELHAYPSDGDPEKDVFSVTRKYEDNGYIYTDTYEQVVAGYMFDEFLQKFLDKELGEGNAVTYTWNTGVINAQLPVQIEELFFNLKTDTEIFVDSENVTEDVYEEFINKLYSWLEEYGFETKYCIYLAKKGVLSEITPYNFRDYYSEEYWIRNDSGEYCVDTE